MLNPKSILLEHGLSISKIFCCPQRNDIIDELFLDYSLTNSEEEINWNILSSANIDSREEKDSFYENSNLIRNSNESSPKTRYFHLSKNKKINRGKRGRHIIKKNNSSKPRKEHKNTSFDNLLRKIQVHFLNFLINLCNDALNTEFDNFPFSFKLINTLTKESINSTKFNEFKEKTIIYFLKLDISSKYKRFKISHNKNLLQNEKIKNSQWLNGLFNMKYIELFNYYYNDRFPLNKLIFNNKIINISKKTKSFYYLLEKNKNIRTELINASIDVFGFGFRPFSILYAK
jgi:hypothetical protein